MIVLRKWLNYFLASLLGVVLFLELGQAVGNIGSAFASVGQGSSVAYVTVDPADVQPNRPRPRGPYPDPGPRFQEEGELLSFTPSGPPGLPDVIRDCQIAPHLPGCAPPPPPQEEEEEPAPPPCPAPVGQEHKCRPNPEA